MTRTLMAMGLFAGALCAQVAPYIQNFDTATPGSPDCALATAGVYPAGWVDGGGSGAWAVYSGATPSFGTGPSADVSGSGNYIYAEASFGCDAGEFIIVAPSVDISGVVRPVLVFQVHKWGADQGTLVAEELRGAAWVEVARITGNRGDRWITVDAPLTPGASASVRFRSFGAVGFEADVAIDEVRIVESTLALDLQPNSPESSLAFTTGQEVLTCTQSFVLLNSDTVNAGQFFDILVNLGPIVRRSQGALSTPGGQVFNLNVLPGALSSVNFALQGTSFVPHPGQILFPIFASTGFLASGQQLVVNPASFDGYTLSAPIQLDARTANVGPFAGPVADDAALEVVFASVPACAQGLTLPFAGTAFTSVTIDTNGRVMFGAGFSDFSPTISEALSGEPMVGHWMDLDARVGAITYGVDAGAGFSVAWSQVPAFGGVTGNDLSISISQTGAIIIDVTGLVDANFGDTFFGLSSGGAFGATDAGPAPFALGATGSNSPANPLATTATDMLYVFGIGDFDPAVASLNGGTGRLIFTPGSRPGEYTWLGL